MRWKKQYNSMKLYQKENIMANNKQTMKKKKN